MAYKQLIDPIGNAGDPSEETLDTIGWRHVTIIVGIGNQASNCSVLKLQEGDASNMSDAADIAGATFDGGTNIDGTTLALPLASTGDDDLCIFELDLSASRKRYVRPAVTIAGATSGVYCVAILSDATNAPDSQADHGVTGSDIFGIIRV
tara:strand:- start:243 stop:692 length:450 start_codon:yes stop_codon:yes gene_type:complete